MDELSNVTRTFVTHFFSEGPSLSTDTVGTMSSTHKYFETNLSPAYNKDMICENRIDNEKY